MGVSLKKKTKALEILKDYDGNNSYISLVKRDVIMNSTVLSDFQVEYILNNHDFEPIILNKIVKISKWYGEKKQNDWGIEFIPEKLLITSIIGETDTTYNCYVVYRRSQAAPKMCFIPKKAILDPLFITDYNDLDIDFDKYDKLTLRHKRALKDHQKIAIKFLVSREKCILADDMGLGKTMSAIVASIEGGFEKVLVICPASVKTTWKRELNYYIDEDDITIVNGSKWDDKRYTIINYDILDNFYEIPMEQETEEVIEIVKGKEKKVKKPVFITKKEKDEKTGEMVEVQVPKMVKSRKKSLIEQAMKNSQLFQSHFDLIIIDECHRLSNNTSGRYKVISDFIEKSNPRGIFAVTGTPITNRPYNLYNILKLIDAEITRDWEFYVKQYCNGYQITNRSTNKKVWITNGASNLEELKEKIKHLYIRRLKTEIPGLVDKEIKTLYYDLSSHQRDEYNRLWDDYSNAQMMVGKYVEDNKELIEGTILRQYIAKQMMENTIKLAEEHIENDEKVMIVCCYDEEVYGFREYFGDSCVIYNGKMTQKQKDKAEDAFMNNKKIKVFIGQIYAAGVGITLTRGNICIFNSYSWVPGDNQQVMDRLHRLGQENDVTVYYQLFSNTVSEDMFEKVMRKELLINTVIKDEKNK